MGQFRADLTDLGSVTRLLRWRAKLSQLDQHVAWAGTEEARRPSPSAAEDRCAGFALDLLQCVGDVGNAETDMVQPFAVFSEEVCYWTGAHQLHQLELCRMAVVGTFQVCEPDV